MDKIAIITPVYNCEQWLPEMIESIMSQSFDNWELILIDDGSTDASLTICKEYSYKDNRIVVLENEVNKGTASAKNKALDYLRKNIDNYSYFTIIDSDDYCHVDFLKMMHETIQKTKTNVVLCGYTFDEYIVDSNFLVINSNCLYKERDKYRFWPSNCNTCKLFNITIAGEFNYLEGKRYEDVFLIPKILLLNSPITLLKSKLYFYRQRGDSLTSKKEVFTTNKLDRLDALQSNVDFVIENDIDAKSFFFSGYFNYLHHLISLAEKDGLIHEKKALRKRLKNSILKYKTYINSHFERSRIFAFRFGYNSLIYRLVARLFR